MSESGAQNRRHGRLFFADANLAVDDRVVLEDGEARHILRALRLAVGDDVELTNGRGVRALARIDDLPGGGSVRVRVTGRQEIPESPRRLLLACAPPKGERQSVLLGMTTQLGVHGYIPLRCDHGVVTHHARMNERWRRIIISACKQSRRARFPQILPAMTLDELVDGRRDDTLLVADPAGDDLRALDSQALAHAATLVAVVGPEGGFSAREEELLGGRNILKLRLGSQILRTETAAVAIIAAVNQTAWR